MAGWVFSASGLTQDAEVIARILEGLTGLGQLPGVQLDHAGAHATDEGWTAAAHGSGDDPDAHQAVLEAATAAIDTPGAATGTSEFNGPYVSAQNFHAPADAAPPPAPGPGGDGVTGTGGPPPE